MNFDPEWLEAFSLLRLFQPGAFIVKESDTQSKPTVGVAVGNKNSMCV